MGTGRPTNRTECRDQPGACPFISCRYNLLIDVTQRGALHLNVGFTKQHDGYHSGYDRSWLPVFQTDQMSNRDMTDAANGIVDWIEQGYPTCALDVVDVLGALTLKQAKVVMGTSNERIRQIEARALRKLADPLCQRDELFPDWLERFPRGRAA